MSKTDEHDPISPYQRRLYDAVIFGHDKGRSRANRALRAVWLSRRRLQRENSGLHARLRLVEALATDAQIASRDAKGPVRADWLYYALNGVGKPPEGFEAWKTARKAM
ncbi:hypothetical protein [Nocardia africana]